MIGIGIFIPVLQRACYMYLAVDVTNNLIGIGTTYKEELNKEQPRWKTFVNTISSSSAVGLVVDVMGGVVAKMKPSDLQSGISFLAGTVGALGTDVYACMKDYGTSNDPEKIFLDLNKFVANFANGAIDLHNTNMPNSKGLDILKLVAYAAHITGNLGLISNTNLFQPLSDTGIPFWWPFKPRDSEHVDPVALNITREGSSKTLDSSHAKFDYNGDGFAEQTAWIGKYQGLLVIDRNGNGTIDDGKELFGNQTILRNGRVAADGYQALNELDGNHDGIIDVTDARWKDLRVWGITAMEQRRKVS